MLRAANKALSSVNWRLKALDFQSKFLSDTEGSSFVPDMARRGRGNRMPSGPWGRLKPVEQDPLQSIVLPSKGDDRYVIDGECYLINTGD